MTDDNPQSELDPTWVMMFIVWLLAAISMVGSLFFSEVMGVTPCILCWYQRIAMYPLVFILPMGMFPLDSKLARYVLPLPIAGWLLALFHLGLVAGIIPESIQPCSQGIPCSEISIQWFGFLTIPLMSLLAFSTIIGLLIMVYKRGAK